MTGGYRPSFQFASVFSSTGVIDRPGSQAQLLATSPRLVANELIRIGQAG